MEKKVKHIELTVDDIKNVKKISFVKEPAMESKDDFMYFNKDNTFEMFNKVDEEKGICTGLAMRPDKIIDRINKFTGEKYTVSFSKEAVRNASIYFMKEKRNDQVNLEHKYDIDGVSLIESYIITDEKCNNAVALGFKDVKEGDWFTSFKIDNEDLKKLIKAKEVTGFSVEGMFINSILEEKERKEFNKVEKFEAIKISGMDRNIYLIGEVKVGEMVYDNLPVKALIDNEVKEIKYPVYDSIIELEDGRSLELANGKIINIIEKKEFNKNKRIDRLLNFIENHVSDIDLCLSKIEKFKQEPPLHENCKCKIEGGKWIVNDPCDICKDAANSYNEFSEEFVVKPEAGENENDFMSRCIKIEVDGGMENDQAIAVCINKWKEK